MRHLKNFSELNESAGVKLNPEITDERKRMDFSEGIHAQVNHLYDMVKTVLESNGLKIENAYLTAWNKYDGYKIGINNNMVLNVSFGKVGLEDQRGGSIDIRYNNGKEVVNKKSRHFGDVDINVEDQKTDILNALNKIIKSK